MEKSWDKESPHVRIMKRLIRERAIDLMRSPEYLRSLRHRNDIVVSDQRRFGHIWQEHDTNIYKLIAEAQDAEDEQKEAFRAQCTTKKEAPVNQRGLTKGNDNLASTCEESPRGWIDELQGESEASFGLVEEAEGSLSGARAEEEAQGQEEEKRSGSFYRRAGGSGP